MLNKKEAKLINKVNHLLRKANAPKYLHHYGPKTYTFLEHFTILILKYYCRCSYRRIVYLCNLLGIKCPSKSALQYTAKKLKSEFWNLLLRCTSSHNFVAMDSTGISRTNPSYHYLKRIDGKLPRIPVKLNAVFDVVNKKFCAAKVRVLHSHDCKDISTLLRNIKRKFGSNILAKKSCTIKTEIYGRLICHNIFQILLRFRTEPDFYKDL